MPTIKRTVDLAANGTANLLSGNQYEYLPYNAQVRMAILADPGDAVDATVYSGTDVLLEAAQLDEKPVTEPVTTRDIQLEDMALAGERLSIQVRETAGAAARVRAVVWITFG